VAAKWLRLSTFILIPTLLIIAWLTAKPHEAKPRPPEDRLQWSAKAASYKPLTGAEATAATSGTDKLLNVSPDSLAKASLQVSCRMKPLDGSADSADSAVNPNGSGTLAVSGSKYSFLIDSTSLLQRRQLSDGSQYVYGPLAVEIQTPQGTARASIAVSAILGSNEGLLTYPNPGGQGAVTFGTGFTKAHAAEIDALR
jgi:hypothetical protein